MKDKIITLYKKYEEIILYLFFGVLTTIISVGLYWLLDVTFNHIAEVTGNPGLTPVSYTHLDVYKRQG